MASLLEILSLDIETILTLLVNLGIAVVILTSIHSISGTIASIDASNELAEKDNPAFGISLAGVVLAVTIMMTGAISGTASGNIGMEALMVISYGVLGIILMVFTRFIFDKISMPKFSMRKEILKKNAAAGVLDAGNVIATAIMVRAVMMWIEEDSLRGVIVVLAGYFISQFILSLASYYRLMAYNKAHKESMQQTIQEGNAAIAWRFTGYRIGVALAITATTGLVPYDLDTPFLTAGIWALVSFILMALVSITSIIADRVILFGINTKTEVDREHNVSVGAIQCVIHIAIGLLVASLLH